MQWVVWSRGASTFSKVMIFLVICRCVSQVIRSCLAVCTRGRGEDLGSLDWVCMTVHMEIFQSDVRVILRDIVVVEGVLLQAPLACVPENGLDRPREGSHREDHGDHALFVVHHLPLDYNHDCVHQMPINISVNELGPLELRYDQQQV